MIQEQQPSESVNPYAPPQAAQSAAPIRTHDGPITEQELRAFFGSRWRRYLDRWGSWTQGRSAGFNWVAFFFAGLWLPYRKMYRVALVFYAIMLLESVLEAAQVLPRLFLCFF